ncbi:NUDIX domain-containing protein [Methylomonas sp. EFPC3]|uniref:NUDIX domain-containing protein n=1 Tax=Methylomonas sp. EFPC3 TaxID=3021710 RepID=UPI00325B87E3
MMDLGATLCTRNKPLCEICPVAASCQARQQGLTRQLPQAKPRKALPIKQTYWLLLQDADDRILLEKRPPTGIWGGLWSLPEFDDMAAAGNWCRQQGRTEQTPQVLPTRRHTFSHYHLDYTPLLARLENPRNNVMEADRTVWYKAADFALLGLPTPVKRLLQQHYPEDYYDENG